MIFKRLVSAWALACATFSPSFAADQAPLYRLQDLGSQSEVTALGVHDRPLGSFSNGELYQAGTFARGRWHALDGVYDAATILGANDVGDLVGYDASRTGRYRAQRWTPDGKRHVIALPGDSNGYQVGQAMGVSRDGLVVGRYATSLDNWTTENSCFIARPGEKAIDPSPGYCVMGGVNASGMVAAAGPRGLGFIWYDGQVRRVLEPLPGYELVKPMAINDKGHVTGQLYGSRVPSVTFLWKNGEMTSLGTLDDGYYGYSRSINNHGVIVGDVVTSAWEQHAVIVLDGQLQRLAPLVSNLGNWDLRSAVAVGDDGSIVGMGWLDGTRRAWRLVPIKRPD